MKKIHFIFSVLAALALTLFTACSKEETDQKELALQTAKTYYDQLAAGDTNAFFEGTLKGDSLPDDYKAQLALNIQMYAERLQKEHQGISEVKAIKATCDSIKIKPDSVILTAKSILVLCFKDSMREEIVVPMVRKNKIWYMQ